MRFLLLAVILMACGGNKPVPKRLVVEGDLGSWKFRRFQGPLLDIEVWVDGNKGEAYSASYITATSEKVGHIADKDLVNVTVTKYETKEGVVRETVRLVRRLAAEKGYQVNEKKTKGVRALAITGPSETWMIWPSGKYVVKVGGQGRESVPDTVIASYGSRYPSQLPGGSLEGPLPTGPDPKPKTEPKDAYDPKNPKPDIDKYDPKKVKIPKERQIGDPPPDEDEPKKPEKSTNDKPDKKSDKKADKKKKPAADDEEDDKPKKADKKKKPAADDEEDDKPKKADKKKKKPAADEDEEDEKPKKKKKKSDDDE